MKPSEAPVAKKTTISHYHTDSALKSDAPPTLANLINPRSDAIEKMVDNVRIRVKCVNEKIICV